MSAKSVPNAFGNIKTAKTKSGSAKPQKPQRDIKRLRQYAAVAFIKDAMDAMLINLQPEIHEQMVDDYLVPEGVRQKKRPENFRGNDGATSASLELKKRSSRSPLDDTQIEMCEAAGLETEEVVEYSFDNELLSEAVMEKISKALATDKTIPEGIIVGVKKTISTDRALDQIFQKGEDVAKMMIPVVGTLSVKPSFGGTLAEASEIVAKMLDADTKKSANDLLEALKKSVEATKEEVKKRTTDTTGEKIKKLKKAA